MPHDDDALFREDSPSQLRNETSDQDSSADAAMFAHLLRLDAALRRPAARREPTRARRRGRRVTNVEAPRARPGSFPSASTDDSADAEPAGARVHDETAQLLREIAQGVATIVSLLEAHAEREPVARFTEPTHET